MVFEMMPYLLDTYIRVIIMSLLCFEDVFILKGLDIFEVKTCPIKFGAYTKILDTGIVYSYSRVAACTTQQYLRYIYCERFGHI